MVRMRGSQIPIRRAAVQENRPARRPRPEGSTIAAIALAFFCFIFRGPAAILRKGPAHVVALLESALRVAPHVSFVAAGVDQLSSAMFVWHHDLPHGEACNARASARRHYVERSSRPRP